MKRVLLIVFTSLLFISGWSQHILKISVKNDETHESLAGASVIIASQKIGKATDSLGNVVISNLPAGNFFIEVSYVGFQPVKKKITLPVAGNAIEITLEPNDDEDNSDVIISATRTDRSIRNTPTRVEVIAGGEISENVSMRPGEIKMLLNETTGILTQQTSAISNTANIRIQELDGRYTQVLRDGFPLYSGLSEGLSLVQVAPLDLKQVEIIKGSSSTLYGGGAIAGLINLVSKTPLEKRELSFLANATSTRGLDLSSFYGEKYGKTGLTVFISSNSGAPYDPAHIGLTAIPKFQRLTFSPRFFIYGKKLTANFGMGYITERRLGGNMEYVKHGGVGYFEKNQSGRMTTQAQMNYVTGKSSSLSFKNSYNHFNRKISIPGYTFEGRQQSSFSELSWTTSQLRTQWVAGINLYTDNFKEALHTAGDDRSYHYTTVGAFIQNTWSPSDLLNIEAGLRADHTGDFGIAILPRLSLLFHLPGNLTSRIGGGMGYKIPTLFTEESEEKQFQNILPVNRHLTSYERSAGFNFDINYRTSIDEVKFNFNPLFFYTRINHPLVLKDAGAGKKEFLNATGYTDSKGADISLRISWKWLKFFTGYSYTVAQQHEQGITTTYPLAPRHRLHFDLVYEKENSLRIAFESYYTSAQSLTDGSQGRSYWLIGALIEKSWQRFSLFINGEDLNDARQTRWGPIYTGSIDKPGFKDIYTPLEGRTINGGIKWKIF
jgi:iron complex outermembrane receptor protein